MNWPDEEDDDPPFDAAEKPMDRLQVLLRQWGERYGDAALNAELDARRDAELDERRELLAWEEELATNDAYERLAGGWIGKEVA